MNALNPEKVGSLKRNSMMYRDGRAKNEKRNHGDMC